MLIRPVHSLHPLYDYSVLYRNVRHAGTIAFDGYFFQSYHSSLFHFRLSSTGPISLLISFVPFIPSSHSKIDDGRFKQLDELVTKVCSATSETAAGASGGGKQGADLLCVTTLGDQHYRSSYTGGCMQPVICRCRGYSAFDPRLRGKSSTPRNAHELHLITSYCTERLARG
ncbi:uncharacterized protein EI90DRAFT_3029586 [Cantharellus anzutake]|uniref:uncharacterized protein n=1 Tax=Cantharellus anzutake TaxID=1750568 RepID=UPI0019044851|nr:uncharacterized protein EI90DRAFT_3029586 [Cantharellus anzutake]KAF8342607.1 hypothetical protein EI90DRAFT_3029586 [Cantharellus anzutake]